MNRMLSLGPQAMLHSMDGEPIQIPHPTRAPGSTPLYLAVRVRSMMLDVATGHIEVGLRVFGFWKSGLDFPEGTVLRQKHGEISNELDQEIPDIQLMGRVMQAHDAEADRELKFHHVPEIDTDTMVTVFQCREQAAEPLRRVHPFASRALR
jgi:hypothetical protein